MGQRLALLGLALWHAQPAGETRTQGLGGQKLFGLEKERVVIAYSPPKEDPHIGYMRILL